MGTPTGLGERARASDSFRKPLPTTIFAMAALGEPATVARILCLGLIVCGIVGLKLLH